ncbi:MAG: hypothetical protein DI528_09840 [Shinella sp.]|nr:MAG: hypothetical protein DI528_09840 [Shinella sp.]
MFRFPADHSTCPLSRQCLHVCQPRNGDPHARAVSDDRSGIEPLHLDTDRQCHLFLALRIQRHQFEQQLRQFARHLPLQCDGTGPAADPQDPAGPWRHRHLADRRPAPHLLHSFADVEQHRPALSVKRPYKRLEDHLRLAIRLTPNAGRDALEGVEENAEGEAYLRARVTSVPEKGKANKALIALVAKAVGVPKSSVSLVSGETARQKILRIDGDPEDLERRLDGLSAA